VTEPSPTPPVAPTPTRNESDSIFSDPYAALAAENIRLRRLLAEARIRIRELEALADSDPLTPLPNRRRFLRELDRLIGEVRRYGIKAALLFIDVDRLKAINDTYGHSSGDAALVHIARLLVSEVRATDIVARLGGDEFGLILAHVDAAQAQEKADALVHLIAKTPFTHDGIAIDLTASVGCCALDGNLDALTALSRADSAMYARKAPQARSDR
jgi:diguanylate cyclase (GGDEF)-like protein